MTPARKQRLTLIAIMVGGVAIAVGFALKAFQENQMFFFSPTEVAEGKPPKHAPFRLGGMVVAGSVRRPEGVKVLFDLSDYHKSVTVQYEGILPDLFREGQGMVALSRLGPDGVFVADEVLAKHDENYMPPAVNDAVMKGQALQKAADKKEDGRTDDSGDRPDQPHPRPLHGHRAGRDPRGGAQRGIASWVAMARPAAWGQLLFMLTAYGCLTYAFLTHDFSVAYVAHNSNVDLPLIYRVSGVWGAHEGSLLLWALTLSAWTAAVGLFSRSVPRARSPRQDLFHHRHPHGTLLVSRGRGPFA